MSEQVNILLVDDTPAKLLTYEVMLRDLGENLITAGSADEALQILLKTEVALILTDVSMPSLDGFGFAKLLREHPRFASTAVIFVTASALSDMDQLRGYDTGGLDYVTVPVAPELLRAKVRVFVDLYRKQRELEALRRELEQRVAERTSELQASEQRYRALVDNANDIVATLDLDFRFTSVNPAAQRILGYPAAEMVGTPLSRYASGKELELLSELLERKSDGHGETRCELQVTAKDRKEPATVEFNFRLVRDDAGEPKAIHAVCRDVTRRKEAEARQFLLIRELQHRTKNILAVIQAIATSTLRRAPDLQTAHDALVGRIHALANAQEFVATGPVGGVPLRDLVDAALRTFGARATASGIPLVVGGSFAQTFALLLHELATNAAKHGALSAATGTVTIDWKVIDAERAPQLQFSWIERGGPPVTPPSRSGLGTDLISGLGNAKVAFDARGFEYVLELPLSEVTKPRSDS